MACAGQIRGSSLLWSILWEKTLYGIALLYPRCVVRRIAAHRDLRVLVDVRRFRVCSWVGGSRLTLISLQKNCCFEIRRSTTRFHLYEYILPKEHHNYKFQFSSNFCLKTILCPSTLAHMQRVTRKEMKSIDSLIEYLLLEQVHRQHIFYDVCYF